MALLIGFFAGKSNSRSQPSKSITEVSNSPSAVSTAIDLTDLRDQFEAELARASSAELIKLLDQEDNYQMKSMFIAQLHRTDPKGANDFLKRRGSDIFTQESLGNLRAAFSDQDMGLTDSAEGGDRVDRADSVATRLQPDRQVSKSKQSNQSRLQVQNEFTELGKSDGRTAFHVGLKQPSDSLQEIALRAAAPGWASEDPDALLEWIETNRAIVFEIDSDLPDILEKIAFRAKAIIEPKFALEKLEFLNLRKERWKADGLLSGLTAKHPALVHEWIAENPNRMNILGSFDDGKWIRPLARSLPKQHLALLESLESNSEFEQFSRHGKVDAFSSLVSTDLGAALTLFDVWKKGRKETRGFTQIIINNLREEDEETFLKWADGHVKSGDPAVVKDLTAQMASKDPLEAVRFLKSTGFSTEDPAYSKIVLSIAYHWRESDLTAASKWIETLPTSRARSMAMSTVLNRWAQSDPIVASEWLEKIAEHEDIDGVVMTFVNVAKKSNPALAVKWASRLKGHSRESTLADAFGEWILKDGDVALRALESADLSEEEKLRTRNRHKQSLRHRGRGSR